LLEIESNQEDNVAWVKQIKTFHQKK
jgi:hypothetical protein